MPEPKPIPPMEDLLDCRDDSMTLIEIAEEYEVSVSTVKRWIRHYNITLRQAKRPEKSGLSPGRIDQFMTLLDKAKHILGSRIKEDRIRGYLLDGRPLKADGLILAAGLVPR